MAAAHLMVQHRVGLLRTLPPAEPYAIERLHRTARALGIGWPEARSYPDFIRSLDPTDPRDVAMMTACTTVLRGAGYVALDGGVPAHSGHSALASQYAHATAPLRRSEEHTSELQSLMRSSYAVFCLKKKKERETSRENRQNINAQMITIT